MIIKLLQLNILKGRYIDNVIRFVKNNDFDILNFQEVAGGGLSFTGDNLFDRLKQSLGYDGVIGIAYGRSDTFMANAIFYRKSFRLKNEVMIKYAPYHLPNDLKTVKPAESPRNIMVVTLEKDGKQIEIVNTHLVWSPTPVDTPDKIAQGKLLVDYVVKIELPFVVTGDFNVDENSTVITGLNRIARNLTVESNVTNTLNPGAHRVKELFPPGLAVDFTFVSRQLTVKDFHVINRPTLSDHLGLSLTVML